MLCARKIAETPIWFRQERCRFFADDNHSALLDDVTCLLQKISDFIQSCRSLFVGPTSSCIIKRVAPITTPQLSVHCGAYLYEFTPGHSDVDG
jgi:hypothetical protein